MVKFLYLAFAVHALSKDRAFPFLQNSKEYMKIASIVRIEGGLYTRDAAGQCSPRGGDVGDAVHPRI
jgi:hypothetical protein